MTTPNEKCILAIDLGTSGPKVAVVTVDGTILGSEFEEVPIHLTANGGAEQEPGQWWQAIVRACGRLKEQGLFNRGALLAISCTSQWSGTVAVGHDGQPLTNAIIWMDSRGAPHIREMTGGQPQIAGYGVRNLLRWVRLTGGIPGHSGKDPISHILYLKHAHPDIYESTYKFLEPKDYLNLRLTGKYAASFDSITLHWLTDNRDLGNVRYSGALLRLSGIPRSKLPDLKRSVDILGDLLPEVALELGIAPGIPVIMGTPDVQSAALGSGAVRDFQGHLYLGTSSWLTCHLPFKKTDLFHNMAALPSAIPGRYFVANEQESAGACLNYLKNNLLLQEDELHCGGNISQPYKLFDRIAERVAAGSGRVIFTPWLYGERTPVEDHSVRAGFYNQSLQTTRDHLIRAVFEGVAYNSRWLLQYVEKFINRRFDALNVIGGGANSDIWCQIHADVLDRPMRKVNQPMLANLRGATWLASVALGHMRFDDIAEHTQIDRVFEPDSANRKIYDLLFGEFLNIYKQNKGIYRRLNLELV